MKEKFQFELGELLELLTRLRSEGRMDINIMADVLVDIDITVSGGSTPLTVDASGVPATATVGTPYSGDLVASGGTPPYTFTDVSASQTPPASGFPGGVTLNADGSITGTPIAAGSFAAVVDVGDSAGATAQVRLRNKTK